MNQVAQMGIENGQKRQYYEDEEYLRQSNQRILSELNAYQQIRDQRTK